METYVNGEMFFHHDNKDKTSSQNPYLLNSQKMDIIWILLVDSPETPKSKILKIKYIQNKLKASLKNYF